MKLVQKKCPNCGAGLQFKQGSKEVFCEYCKQSYLLLNDEFDKKDIKKKSITVDELNESIHNMPKSDKVAAMLSIGIAVAAPVIFILIVIIFMIIMIVNF